MSGIKNNRGVVSILTVVFVAVLLSIITIAFVRLAVNEQRQSSDDDLTTAAFYAAESGIEDAVRAVSKYQEAGLAVSTLNGEDCGVPTNAALGSFNPILSGTNGIDAEYSCQLIDLSPNDLEAQISEGETNMFTIKPVLSGTADTRAKTGSLKIQWHNIDEDYSPVALRTSSANNTLQFDDWGDGTNPFPPVLRVELFGHENGDISRSVLDNKQVAAFFDPVNGNSGAYSVDNIDGKMLDAACSTTNPDGRYYCSAIINLNSEVVAELGRPGMTTYARIKPVYGATTVRIQAFSGQNATGDSRDFADGQLVVDVTGRSGQVYRRLLTRYPLDTQGSLIDYVLIGGDGICKDFKVSGIADEPTPDPDTKDFSELNPGLGADYCKAY